MMNGSILRLKIGETRLFAVSFRDRLRVLNGQPQCQPANDEFLTGTPTVQEIGSSALTFANQAVTSIERLIADIWVPAYEAVEFTVSGGVARSQYTVRITVGTNSTPAQTLVQDIRIYVE